MRPVSDPTTVRPRGRPSRGVRKAILDATRAVIRDGGLAGATSSAIAARAGASEASIHYHFGGKEALLETAILEALGPVRGYEDQCRSSGKQSGAAAVLELAGALERSYDELLPLLAVVQSDPQLREAVAPRLSAHDLGPHRAVARLARLIDDCQPSDRGDADIDAEAAALLLAGACFLRAWQRNMSTHRRRRLPSLARAVATLLGADPIGERDSD